MSWITEEKVGVAQDVPSTSSAEPEATITTLVVLLGVGFKRGE